MTGKEFIDFFNRFRVSAKTSCWNWCGVINEDGYGHFYMKIPNRPIRAHRASYEHFVSPIPKGLTINHKCRNKGCVNPGHLEVMTSSENNRLSKSPSANNMKKIRCLNGHKLSGDNLYLREDRVGRICRKCCAMRTRKYRALKTVFAFKAKRTGC